MSYRCNVQNNDFDENGLARRREFMMPGGRIVQARTTAYSAYLSGPDAVSGYSADMSSNASKWGSSANSGSSVKNPRTASKTPVYTILRRPVTALPSASRNEPQAAADEKPTGILRDSKWSHDRAPIGTSKPTANEESIRAPSQSKLPQSRSSVYSDRTFGSGFKESAVGIAPSTNHPNTAMPRLYDLRYADALKSNLPKPAPPALYRSPYANALQSNQTQAAPHQAEEISSVVSETEHAFHHLGYSTFTSDGNGREVTVHGLHTQKVTALISDRQKIRHGMQTQGWRSQHERAERGQRPWKEGKIARSALEIAHPDRQIEGLHQAEHDVEATNMQTVRMDQAAKHVEETKGVGGMAGGRAWEQSMAKKAGGPLTLDVQSAEKSQLRRRDVLRTSDSDFGSLDSSVDEHEGGVTLGGAAPGTAVLMQSRCKKVVESDGSTGHSDSSRRLPNPTPRVAEEKETSSDEELLLFVGRGKKPKAG